MTTPTTSEPRRTRRPVRPVLRVGRRVVVPVVLGLVAVLGAGAASAAPDRGAAADQAAPGSGVGTIPPLPPPPAQDQAAIVAGAAGAPKPKISLALPVQVQHVYATVKVNIGDQLVTESWAFVVSNPGPDPSYGLFPDTPTAAMAFGSIPVTATVHLVQASDATGTLIPIKLINYADIRAPFASDSDVTGTVLARVSDVEVDGVPVDVGAGCVGSTPIDLTLTGHDDGGHRKPTDYNPFAGGPLEGTFTVPSFTGCIGASGEDLSPLITGTVSGPGNVLRLNQGPLGEWDTKQPQDCRISDTRRPCKTPTDPALPTP